MRTRQRLMSAVWEGSPDHPEITAAAAEVIVVGAELPSPPCLAAPTGPSKGWIAISAPAEHPEHPKRPNTRVRRRPHGEGEQETPPFPIKMVPRTGVG